MKKQPIAITTIARGKTLEEQNLVLRAHDALHTSISATGENIPSTVSFMESNPDLDDGTIRRLESMGSNVSIIKSNHSDQLVNALQEGDKLGDIVLYAEGDKKDYFEKGFRKTLAFIKSHPGLDVYIVQRSQENFQTFPEGQQYWEKLFSDYVNQFGGNTQDYLYGPKAFKDVSRFLGDVGKHPGLGRGVLTYIIGKAMSQSAIIIGADGGVDCPEDQRQEKNVAYREVQYNQNKQGFDLGIGK